MSESGTTLEKTYAAPTAELNPSAGPAPPEAAPERLAGIFLVVAALLGGLQIVLSQRPLVSALPPVVIALACGVGLWSGLRGLRWPAIAVLLYQVLEIVWHARHVLNRPSGAVAYLLGVSLAAVLRVGPELLLLVRRPGRRGMRFARVFFAVQCLFFVAVAISSRHGPRH
jgi:hypothetical protein